MEQPSENRVLFVEFIGLPGAGKTTIAREIMTNLKQQGIRVADIGSINRLEGGTGKSWKQKIGRLPFYFYFIFRHWRLSKSVIYYVLRTKPVLIEDVIKVRHVFALDETYRRMREGRLADNYDVAISDRGILHVVFSLTAMKRVPSRDSLRELLGIIFERHDIYPVMLSIDAHTAQERIVERETSASRYDFLSREQALERLTLHQATIAELFETSARLSPEGGLPIEASRSIAENTKVIAAAVCEKLRDRSRVG